jgi:hypothetical protein
MVLPNGNNLRPFPIVVVVLVLTAVAPCTTPEQCARRRGRPNAKATTRGAE